MLQYQIGYYSIIIWDDSNVDLGKALDSLEIYDKDKDDSKVVFAVNPTLTSDSCASKTDRVLLASALIRERITYEGKTSDSTLRQICETAEALANLAYALGFSNSDISDMLSRLSREDARFSGKDDM